MKREIKYISSFFTYDILRFHNPELVYLQAVLLAGSFYGDDQGYDLDDKSINMMIGLELLSIGAAFHSFKTSISNKTVEEKEYTLDLLFGDIFYSRAVIYLLKYQDHGIFDKILKSMKRLHEGRLKLHMKMQEAIEEKIEPSLIGSDMGIMVDANRLLHISFEIGDSILEQRGQDRSFDDYQNIVEKTVLLKTYNELLEYINAFSKTPAIDKISDHLSSKKNFTGKELSDIISKSDSGAFRSNMDILLMGLKI